MPLDAGASRFIQMMRDSGRPPIETQTPIEAREGSVKGRAITQPAPAEVASVKDHAVAGPVGKVMARVYRPLGSRPDQILPAMVYYHGGGWVIGDLDSHDVFCRALCNRSGASIIATDYRLAPEHKFPAAVDDSAAVTAWAIRQADILAIDPARVAVGGDSAGGNLAAVMALMSRDGDLPPVKYQVLIYPVTDLVLQHPSHERFTGGLMLTAAGMRWFRNHYLRDERDATDWRASPLRASSLIGAAPAFVMTVGHDPLRDEGEDYARRLERDGVNVTYAHVGDQIHGFIGMGRIIPAAEVGIDFVAAALRNGLAG